MPKLSASVKSHARHSVQPGTQKIRRQRRPLRAHFKTGLPQSLVEMEMLYPARRGIERGTIAISPGNITSASPDSEIAIRYAARRRKYRTSSFSKPLNMTKISIAIPAYNAEACLHETLESALAQTCQAHKILVVDDGSKDRIASGLKFASSLWGFSNSSI
jgi:Glycosyl transferase family 2